MTTKTPLLEMPADTAGLLDHLARTSSRTALTALDSLLRSLPQEGETHIGAARHAQDIARHVHTAAQAVAPAAQVARR